MRESASHLKAITSARFVAAMGIVLLHSAGYWRWGESFRSPVFVQAVSFFFVLSGFVLTHVYLERPLRYGAFLWTRVAKLWPTHAATLVLLLLAMPSGTHTFPGTGAFAPAWTLLANLSLVHAAVPFLGYAFSWNAVSWSISTEMFFYAAFPLLVLSIRTTWHLKLGLCLLLLLLYGAVCSALALPTEGSPDTLTGVFLTYPSPLFRLAEFVVGMSAYVLSERWRAARANPLQATAAEFAGIAVAWLWYARLYPSAVSGATELCWPTLAYWVQIASSCVVFALLLAVFSRGDGLVGRALSIRPLVWLGQISFALYMVHQVLMRALSVAEAGGRIDPPGPWVVIPTCLAAAALIHHAVERPAQAWLVRLGTWPGGRLRKRKRQAMAPAGVELGAAADGAAAARP